MPKYVKYGRIAADNPTGTQEEEEEEKEHVLLLAAHAFPLYKQVVK